MVERGPWSDRGGVVEARELEGEQGVTRPGIDKLHCSLQNPTQHLEVALADAFLQQRHGTFHL